MCNQYFLSKECFANVRLFLLYNVYHGIVILLILNLLGGCKNKICNMTVFSICLLFLLADHWFHCFIKYMVIFLFYKYSCTDNDCGVGYFFPLETVKFSINCIRRKRLSKIFLMTFYVICPLFGTSTDAIETMSR